MNRVFFFIGFILFFGLGIMLLVACSEINNNHIMFVLLVILAILCLIIGKILLILGILKFNGGVTSEVTSA
jgi:hypothetical protein